MPITVMSFHLNITGAEPEKEETLGGRMSSNRTVQ